MKKFGFLLVAVCIVAFTACSPSTTGPEKVVENYLDALKAGEYEKSIDYLDINASEAEEEQIKMLVEKTKQSNEESDGLKSYEITSVEVGELKENEKEIEAKAEVKATLTYGNDQTKEDSFNLVKKGGKWKIALF
ncbi:MAG: DUF4878 domain-containing protein [Lentimicrobiaceae bacterium]|nr:DUF4878 domain-containing protein [Lentimicrobiaceae bacterium]